MSEVIRVRDEYYILATSALADDRTRVLKQDVTFAVLDRHGDVRRLGRGEQGLYHDGTRYLSRSVLRVGEERPLLLGSSVSEDNVLLEVDLTAPDMTALDGQFVRRGRLHIFRAIFLWDGACYHLFTLTNFKQGAVPIRLAIDFEADFADLFEVRGMERERSGKILPVQQTAGGLVMGYEGLDGAHRSLQVMAEGAEPSESSISFEVELPPREPRELAVTLVCSQEERQKVEPYATAVGLRRETQSRLSDGYCGITTSSEQFDAWLDRSLSDLRMMVTDEQTGPYPYAGVPWFSTPFGRDAIICAYQLLWVNPGLARGVLAFLASTQATDVDPARAAEPGKILHEQRAGEMAALGEHPFASYYGSVDSTPLFVALAGEYLRVTGDLSFIRSIWPNLEAALEWIDKYGDADGDGFIEYRGSTGRGLIQQGWKDSHDSVFHADGTIPSGPIALCEVQGYVYWAKRRASEMCRMMGDRDRAEELLKQAGVLREEFNRVFWSDELGTYALALDGDKRPCLVRASNAGHCLLTQIATEERASLVASQLLSEPFFTGWGIRTLASTEPRYGPITYHNGSVWPHDNALIADGLSRYGHNQELLRVLDGMLDASVAFDLHRLPELFSGFRRRPGQGPVEYPLACAPQAWAAGAVFTMLRACLGLEVEAGQVRLVYPQLPTFLQEVHVADLRAGEATLDLSFHRYADDVGVHVARRTGDVQVLTVK